MTPRFSIVIPTFNRAEVIPRAINSIINQSFQDWELILVDDGSTDNTVNLVSTFSKTATIRYFPLNTNRGVSYARNYGASKAIGQWLIFLDSDDELMADALENFDRSIRKNNSVDVVLAGYQIKLSDPVETQIYNKEKHSARLTGTFCLKRKLFEQVGGYDEKFTFSENTELFYRIQQSPIRTHTLTSASLIYHKSENGGSSNRQNIIQSVSEFLKKHGSSMSRHHKFLYYQILGVQQLRESSFALARTNLWKAYCLKPLKIKTFARLLISWLPLVSKTIYN